MTVTELITELKKVPDKNTEVLIYTGDAVLMELHHIEYHAPDIQWPEDDDGYLELRVSE